MMSTGEIFELLAFGGALVLMVAYAAATRHRLAPEAAVYQIACLSGAALILPWLLQSDRSGSPMVEAALAAAGVVALVRLARLQRSA